ncbi:MAG: neutral zinc metallopeptidase [Geodermatophilaceae bacterium]|nr:neutral zinc metallopeptidase [Geodermatophilaceae bacterium]
MAAAVLSLTACTTTLSGAASHANGARSDVSDAEFTVNLAGDSETDVISRNALADVADYWAITYPEVFGEDYRPLEGGFWSIDPDETDPQDLPNSSCFDDLAGLAENAYYCPGDDAIYFDRAWMTGLAEDFGTFVIAEIMAHEMAHAVQSRANIDDVDSIVAETQAECFAGGWSGWVSEGNAKHVSLRAPELDPYLLGYLVFGDPVGYDPTDSVAHGSFFDQASAFQEGFADGPHACADNVNAGRLYTEEEFTAAERANRGNLPYVESLPLAGQTLETFWDQAFGAGFDGSRPFEGDFVPPTLTGFDSDQPACAGRSQDRDLDYCAEDDSVRFDEADLLKVVHQEVGDFAMDTLLSIPYALSAREQLGLSTDGASAAASAVCLTGWFTRELYDGKVSGSPEAVSPGDVDEAVIVLLEYATKPSVLPDVGLSGFELVDLFRRGFVTGSASCQLR